MFAAFPAEQVFVGQYEACRADPAARIADTFAFLGLAPFELDRSTIEGEVNPTTREKYVPSASFGKSLVAGYAPDIEQLADLLPGLDLALWPTAVELGLTTSD